MPTYEYRCPNGCANFDRICAIADRNSQHCDCGAPGEREWGTKAPAYSGFQEGWWHDIGPEPIYCRTPQELRDACDKHGAYSHYLENGIWKTNPGPDTSEDLPPAFRGDSD